LGSHIKENAKFFWVLYGLLISFTHATPRDHNDTPLSKFVHVKDLS
jgi:hypothetical protein